jgi:hypothetical protein
MLSRQSSRTCMACCLVSSASKPNLAKKGARKSSSRSTSLFSRSLFAFSWASRPACTIKIYFNLIRKFRKGASKSLFSQYILHHLLGLLSCLCNSIVSKFNRYQARSNLIPSHLTPTSVLSSLVPLGQEVQLQVNLTLLPFPLCLLLGLTSCLYNNNLN